MTSCGAVVAAQDEVPEVAAGTLRGDATNASALEDDTVLGGGMAPLGFSKAVWCERHKELKHCHRGLECTVVRLRDAEVLSAEANEEQEQLLQVRCADCRSAADAAESVESRGPKSTSVQRGYLLSGRDSVTSCAEQLCALGHTTTDGHMSKRTGKQAGERAGGGVNANARNSWRTDWRTVRRITRTHADARAKQSGFVFRRRFPVQVVEGAFRLKLITRFARTRGGRLCDNNFLQKRSLVC